MGETEVAELASGDDNISMVVNMASKTPIFLKNSFAWFFLAFLTIITAQNGNNNDYGGMHVLCTENYMQLTLDRQRYAKIDPASLHLTDRGCGPTFYNSTLMVIRAPLGSCGTDVGRAGILLEFRNEVYGDLIGRSAISREPAYQFRLRCRYYTTAKIVLRPFKPIEKIVVNPPPGFGNFTFETNMFQTDKYISKFTEFPVKVKVGESIYLQVRLKSNATGLSMLLENCWATPTRNENDSRSYPLIKEGCPVDQYLNYKVSDSSYQRFSFDAFTMDGAEVMYLHCEVLVCASNEKNTTRCTEGCVEDNPGGSRRKRRDETSQERKEVTSLGPVKVLDLILGQGPEGVGSRSQSPLVTVEKTAILVTFILASLLVK